MRCSSDHLASGSAQPRHGHAASADVVFRVLGPIKILRAGTTVALGGRRTLTLLTGLLLSANELVAVPTMIDWAWGEELPEHPRAALHNVVARLRSKLGRGLIDATPAGYRLVTDREHLDVLQFEHLVADAAGSAREGRREEALGQLAEALSLWHEPPLGNIDSPALCRDHVGRLIELYLDTQEKHAELCLQLGRHASAARQLAGAVAAHPFREPLVGQLMRALLASGRRADALVAYETLHAGLRADLGVDPCPDLQRLHVRVLRSGADLPPRPDRPPSSGPLPAAPARDLPGVIGRLYGRTRELEELGRRLAADDHGGADNGLVAIVGPAGAGKTALALRAAVRALNRFPDGHVYLNLRGYDDGAPLDPATALGRLLGSLLAAPASIPADLPDRAALYRRLAGGRRMIVILDNARDSRQVRPLLAGAQAACHTIVTSRSQLRGLVVREGAHRIGLAGISAGAARALLADLSALPADTPQGAVAELAGLCAGLPLALRIVAERLARNGQTPGDVTGQVRAGDTPLDLLASGDSETDMRTLLSISYQALDAAAARAYRLLGGHAAASLSLAAAAALLGDSARDTRRILDDLVNVHLLDQRGPDHYRLSALVHAHARECSSSHERARRSAAGMRARLRAAN